MFTKKFSIQKIILCSALVILASCRTSPESTSQLNREGAGVGNTAGFGRGLPQFGWFLTNNERNNETIKFCLIGDKVEQYTQPSLEAAKPWIAAIKNLGLNSPQDQYHFVTTIKYEESCSTANLTIHLGKKPKNISIDIASIKNKSRVKNLMPGGDIYISSEYLELSNKKFHRAMLQSWGHVFGTREISGSVMGKDFLSGKQTNSKVSDLIEVNEVQTARLKGDESCRKTKYLELYARPKGYCLYYGSSKKIDDFDGDN